MTTKCGLSEDDRQLGRQAAWYVHVHVRLGSVSYVCEQRTQLLTHVRAYTLIYKSEAVTVTRTSQAQAHSHIHTCALHKTSQSTYTKQFALLRHKSPYVRHCKLLRRKNVPTSATLLADERRFEEKKGDKTAAIHWS